MSAEISSNVKMGEEGEEREAALGNGGESIHSIKCQVSSKLLTLFEKKCIWL